MALNHKIIEIRKYAGSWEAVIEITDTDSKVVYCEMPKIDGNKPTEKAFLPLIEVAKARITNTTNEKPIEVIEDITMKYTPKDLLTKLAAVKDIDNATWQSIEATVARMVR